MELVKGTIISKPKTYPMHYPCYNCGKESRHEVPWGTLFAELEVTCPHCGCSKKQIDEYYAKKNNGGNGPRVI